MIELFITILLIIILWPLIKAYAFLVLVALVVYWLFFRNTSAR